MARSVGCASRRIGMARISASRSFGLSPPISANSGVSVGPGHTALALIPLRAISLAIVLVNAMIPPLAAAYTASPDEPTRPASDARFTTVPPPCPAMIGSTALQVCSTP